jgi:hypothetical protein
VRGEKGGGKERGRRRIERGKRKGKFRRNNSHERNDGMNGINRIMKFM